MGCFALPGGARCNANFKGLNDIATLICQSHVIAMVMATVGLLKV